MSMYVLYVYSTEIESNLGCSVVCAKVLKKAFILIYFISVYVMLSMFRPHFYSYTFIEIISFVQYAHFVLCLLYSGFLSIIKYYIQLLIYPLINNNILLINALPSILSKMVVIIP